MSNKPQDPSAPASQILADLPVGPDAAMLALTSNPVWIKRDVEQPLEGEASRALTFLYAEVFPYLEILQTTLTVEWIANVMTQDEHTGTLWQHVVLPQAIYEANKFAFTEVGFQQATAADDPRQFACADGLKEALFGGADLEKKWH